MNALRKATEHKRRPFKPVVSKAGRRVLEWLDKYGERYVDGYKYKEVWDNKDTRQPDEMIVVSTTLTALHNRGLIHQFDDQNGVYLVGISVAGRKYLEDTK